MELLDYTPVPSARKTVALIVERDGSLTLRVPFGMSRRAMDNFVAQKADWIAAARARLALRRSQIPSLAFGASVPWLGEDLVLTPGEPPLPRREGNRLYLPREGLEAAWEAWCRREGKAHLAGRVSALAPLLGVAPTGLRITGARGRWGSCSGRNSLCFSWRLLLCPPAAVDYVVLHELAHIRQKNHSPAFWALVKSVCPDYRARQALLKSHGAVMDISGR